jgi:hypothetical protein
VLGSINELLDTENDVARLCLINYHSSHVSVSSYDSVHYKYLDKNCLFSDERGHVSLHECVYKYPDPEIEYSAEFANNLERLKTGNPEEISFLLKRYNVHETKWWYARQLLSQSATIIKQFLEIRAQQLKDVRISDHEIRIRGLSSNLISEYEACNSDEQYNSLKAKYSDLILLMSNVLKTSGYATRLCYKSKKSLDHKLSSKLEISRDILDLVRCRLEIEYDMQRLLDFLVNLIYCAGIGSNLIIWNKDFDTLLPIPKIIICDSTGACIEVQIYMSKKLRLLSEETDAYVYGKIKESVGCPYGEKIDYV